MPAKRLRIVAAGGAAALALAACGGDDSRIPSQQADRMVAQLNDIDAAVDGEDCDSAQTAFGELTGTVEGLGQAVDEQTQDDLRRLAAALQEDLNDFCADAAEPEEPEEVVPPPVETVTPPEETVPPETAPEEEAVPPGQGQGQGGGRGGGPPSDDSSGGLSPEDD